MAETTTTTAPTVDVVDLSGSKVGSVELPGDWFTGEVKVAVMHQVVTAQLAAARQGTAKTKTRSDVRGGGRKPWRQKGTGRARHGSIRSPIWVGGGVAHGRTGNENFTKRVNKRMKRVALRSALTDRANDGNVTVVRGLSFTEPRTKDAVAALAALGHAGRKVLVVLGDLHAPTLRSFRNLQSVHLLTVDQLNTYDVINSDVVVFDENALELIGTGTRTDGAPESTAPERPAEAPKAAKTAEEPKKSATKKSATKKSAPKKETEEVADETESSEQTAASDEAEQEASEETGAVGGTTETPQQDAAEQTGTTGSGADDEEEQA